MSDASRPLPRYKPGYGPRGRLPGYGPIPRIYKRRGMVAEDNAPIDIQRMRKAMCDEFVKTGEFNVELLAKLKEYANAKRRDAESARDLSAVTSGAGVR